MEAWLQGIFADTPVLTVPWSIDYFSVIAGVLTGALFACDRKLDIIGTVVCGLITGYGGGVLRDTLMQGTGVYFTSHPDLIVTCILICAFVFYFRGIFKHLEATVFLADALSVGLFALAGASKAVAFEQGMVLSVIMGGITAVGGGAIRDICVGEVPGVFQRSNYYAVAGLGGAAVYVVLARFGCPLALAGIACVLAVVTLRYWSVYFDWRTTSEADLTPRIARGLHRVGEVLSGLFLHGGDSERHQRHAGARIARGASRDDEARKGSCVKRCMGVLRRLALWEARARGGWYNSAIDLRYLAELKGPITWLITLKVSAPSSRRSVPACPCAVSLWAIT